MVERGSVGANCFLSARLSFVLVLLLVVLVLVLGKTRDEDDLICCHSAGADSSTGWREISIQELRILCNISRLMFILLR
jgi:hypothetical protein